jgi:drug/metabolite transporter (DMT)-like permease
LLDRGHTHHEVLGHLLGAQEGFAGPSLTSVAKPVASGVVLLGEELTATKILGGVIILLGVYLARRR